MLRSRGSGSTRPPGRLFGSTVSSPLVWSNGRVASFDCAYKKQTVKKLGDDPSLITSNYGYIDYCKLGLFRNMEIKEQEDSGLHEKQETMNSIGELISEKRRILCKYGIDFLTAGRVYETFMNPMIGQAFELCGFGSSEFKPLDIAGLNSKGRLKPYEKWNIFKGNHHIDFGRDWSVSYEMDSDESDCYQIETRIEVMPNEGNLKLMTHEHRPLFAMDCKTGGDYASLLDGIGKVILYNGYLANELVNRTNDRDIINDLYYPGALFFNPFAVFFETRFNWSYLRALTALNPQEHNLCKLKSEEFPQTKIFSSKYGSSSADIPVKYETEFNGKCKVQGFHLCKKEELIQAVMMMRQLTFGYQKAGKFDNMKSLPIFKAFAGSLENPKEIDF